MYVHVGCCRATIKFISRAKAHPYQKHVDSPVEQGGSPSTTVLPNKAGAFERETIGKINEHGQA